MYKKRWDTRIRLAHKAFNKLTHTWALTNIWREHKTTIVWRENEWWNKDYKQRKKIETITTKHSGNGLNTHSGRQGYNKPGIYKAVIWLVGGG